MVTDSPISTAKTVRRDPECGQPKISVHQRWMLRRDMDEVLAIENKCFEFPWQDEDFIRCLRQRNCIGMIAEDRRTSQILGFFVYELHKYRLHVLNFAVAPEVRRCGIGRQMVDKLISKLSRDRCSRIVLEVRENNLVACLFFKAMGFRAVNVLRDFYKDSPGESAYQFSYRYRRIES